MPHQISHPVTRSIKEQVARAAPSARVGHALLMLLVETTRGATKPDSPATAQAMLSCRKILTRVHERIVRELRSYLPPPVGMALLLNLAAGLVHSEGQDHEAAQRLARHLLAAPDSPDRLPIGDVVDLCQRLVAADAKGAGRA